MIISIGVEDNVMNTDFMETQYLNSIGIKYSTAFTNEISSSIYTRLGEPLTL